MFCRSRASFLAPFALTFGICFHFVTAQEAVRIEPARPHPIPHVEAGHEYNLKPPRSLFLPDVNRRQSLSSSKLFEPLRKPGPIHLEWQKVRVADGVTGYRARRLSPDGSQAFDTHLTQKELEDLISSNEPVVNSGDVPYGSAWRSVISRYESKTVTHERGSANSDWLSIALATALGDTHIEPAKTKIFNALPSQGVFWGGLELDKMGITKGTPEAWAEANRQISGASQGFQSSFATKKALLEEFRTGTSDVVVIYAHFDGKALHFPGFSGETLSLDEISHINRVGDPRISSRVIILAACSTAAHPADGQSQSLVQTLLANGIARTVFATDLPYNAWNIVPLMENLKSKTIREAAGQLRQHVELDLRDPWFEERHSSMKAARLSGE